MNEFLCFLGVVLIGLLGFLIGVGVENKHHLKTPCDQLGGKIISGQCVKVLIRKFDTRADKDKEEGKLDLESKDYCIIN